MKKIKITHIIVGLNMGGAETMLYKLLKNINKDKYDINVISMMDEGVYGSKIRELGYEVHTLNMKKGIPSLKAFKLAKKHIAKTEIIQTWMYHADLFGYILFKLSKVQKLIWGIRRSNLDVKLNKKSTILIAKLNAILSKHVDIIVSCSINAKKIHEEFGYHSGKITVIPNGFEIDKFNKDSEAKLKVSKIINQSTDVPFIAHVGRWNVLKDYENLIKALNILKREKIKFHTVLVGTNIDYDNKELINLINLHEIKENVSLLGRRNDIPLIMSSATVFVSSSKGEGFPNVVGEAMACETPCVVTDVGDSAYLVGDVGKVVPSEDPYSLAKEIKKILNMADNERCLIGEKARARVVDNFEIRRVTKQFEELYSVGAKK